MNIKFKQLGMLALTMAIITGSILVYGNKINVYGSSIADTSKIENLSIYDRDIHKFNNPTDMMYYSVFGENFKIIQQHSNQINKTEYYNGIRMEVLSTVTISEENSTTHISYTFFNLQDVDNKNRISNTTLLTVADSFTEDSPFIVWGSASPILFNEETQTITFVAIYEHFRVEASNYLEHVPIKILNIVDNYTIDNKIVNNINIVDILSTYNGSFTNNTIWFEDYNIDQLEELGLEFSNMEEVETLKKDELNIVVDGWEVSYISNVALIDNLLHIQTNTPQQYNSKEWYSLELIDTRTNNIIIPIYLIGLENRDEEFNNIDGRIYQEFIYFLEDIDDLQYYSFNLNKYYYDTIIDTNLEVSFLSPILIDSYVTGKDTEILIDNQKASVLDIKAYITNLKFTIDEIEFLPDDTGAYPEEIWVSSNFIKSNVDVTLIYNNGLEQVYLTDIMGLSWGYDIYENVIKNLDICIVGSVIDVNNLVAININGSIIEIN